MLTLHYRYAKKLTKFFVLPIEKYAEICYNIIGKKLAGFFV